MSTTPHAAARTRPLLPAPFVVSAEAAASPSARAVGGVLALTWRLDGASERSLAPSPCWDHVGVLLVRRGAVALRLGAWSTTLAGGDAAVLDFLRPFRLTSEGCEDVLLVLPRAFARVLAVPSHHGAVVRAAHPASEWFVACAATLAGPREDLSTRGAAAAAQALAILLGGCAVDPVDRQGDAATALVRRLMERIDADLASPSLTPARLAADLGVSRAALYRAVDGLRGVTGLVRERRLDRAFALLSDPERGGESLGSIARAVGLSSADQLSRLFLARHGQRAAAVGAVWRGPLADADGGRIAAWMETFDRHRP